MGQGSKLKALAFRNWVLFKRNKLATCCETLFPTIIIFLLIWMRSTVKDSDVDIYRPLTEKNGQPREDPQVYGVSENVFMEVVDEKTQSSNRLLEERPAEVSRTGSIGDVKYDYHTDMLAWYETEVTFGEFSDSDDVKKETCFIALGPDFTITRKLGDVFRKLKHRVKYFNSNSAIEDYITDEDYGDAKDDNICFAIWFSQSGEGSKYEYEFRYNLTREGGFDREEQTLPSTKFESLDELMREYNEFNFKSYRTSDFALFQNLIHTYILQEELKTAGTSDTKANEANIETINVPFSVASHEDNGFFNAFRGLFPLFWVIIYFVPIYRQVSRLVKEKESRIREGMKMMGLTDFAYHLANYSYYFFIFLFLSLMYSLLTMINIFTYSTWIYIFLFFFLYSLAINSYSFFIASFFSNARTGSLTAIFIYFTMWIVGGTRLDEFASRGSKVAGSLGPPLAMMMGANTIASLEGAQMGVTSETVDFQVQNYDFETCLWFLFLDAVLYLLLGLYFDQVWPSQYGVNRHPLFLFQKSYWFPKKRSQTQATEDKEDLKPDESNVDVEEVDQHLQAKEKTGDCLVVRNLKKQFGDFLAVNGLSLKMYEGQIFALLGHNGAGKTTTISCLTGLLTPTGGQSKVFGLDMWDDVSSVRKFMGICPQHDVLYDELTVREHLYMYALFKEIPKKDITPAIDETIKKVDLAEKQHAQSRYLSGGQKRKLSVGIALIGGSKLIFLDEPTSGMDITARRKLWNMLKNNKQGKIIILTTHFMDEADILGDRIAIMSEGKLKTCGSSLYLKKRFGTGYNVTMVKNQEANTSAINTFVTKMIPEAELASETGGELSFQLPTESVTVFPTFFNSLDQSMSRLGVKTYGVSITTLEEVFLNLGHKNQIKKELDKEHELVRGETLRKQSSVGESAAEFDPKLYTIVGNRPETYYGQQFVGLLKKRLIYSFRDFKSLFVEMMLPFLFTAIMILAVKTYPIDDPPSRTLNGDLFPLKQRILYNDGVSGSTNLMNQFNPTMYQPQATRIADANDITGMETAIFNAKDIKPLEAYRYGSYLINTLDNTDYQYRYVNYANTTSQDAFPAFTTAMDEAIIKQATSNTNFSLTSINHPLPYSFLQREDGEKFLNLWAALFLIMATVFFPASTIQYIVKEREQNIKYQQLVSGCNIVMYWCSNWVVDVIKYWISALFVIVLLYIADLEGLVNGTAAGSTWAIFMLYGPAMVSFTYLISFAFATSNGAQNFIIIFGFFFGFVAGMTVWILGLINESTIRVGKVLLYVFRLFPCFSMAISILYIMTYGLTNAIENWKPGKDPHDIEMVGTDMLYLAFEGVVYFAAVIFFEMLFSLEGVRTFFMLSPKKSVYEDETLDDDVVAEAERVEGINPTDGETVVYAKELQKIYNKGGQIVPAVRDVSFGVSKGEVFGLLGVNGAGKTSTFKILVGQNTPTRGDVYIQGYDLRHDLLDAQKYIGYTPQFDALLDFITVEEHLYLYADLKGIPKEYKTKLVEDKLTEMNLAQYRKSKAGNLSGGNKRKLSVALAMIGNPPIVFLDEPSTGMDPEARRFMWTVISNITAHRKQSAVILTTHSMEEAEALSTKIAIMVAGRYKCLGNAQHLKSKFGKGFELDVKIQVPKEEELMAFMEQRGITPSSQLNVNGIQHLLNNVLGTPNLAAEIRVGGIGQVIYEELRVNGTVNSDIFLEWWFIETRGLALYAFLQENFESFDLYEHFQTFYKFRIFDETLSVGSIFNLFERQKGTIFISEYSLSQTSLEQIFHGLANDTIGQKQTGLAQLARTTSGKQDEAIADIQPRNVHIDMGAPKADINTKVENDNKEIELSNSRSAKDYEIVSDQDDKASQKSAGETVGEANTQRI